MMKQNELFGYSIEEPIEGRVCKKCKVKKPHDHFGYGSGGNYRRSECKSCARETREVVKKLHEQNAYPSEEYKCPICLGTLKDIDKEHISQKKFVLDHCHKTKQFRGWLCQMCNRALGNFKDDVKRLKRAIDYLNDST